MEHAGPRPLFPKYKNAHLTSVKKFKKRIRSVAAFGLA